MADTLTGSPFTFEEAKALLASAHRTILADHAFSDAEVTWWLERREVASGYFGSSRSHVKVLGDASHSDTSFTDDKAQLLRQMSKTSAYYRNDQGE